MTETMLLGWLLAAVGVAIVLAVLAARWHADAARLVVEREGRQALATEAGRLQGRVDAMESELRASAAACDALRIRLEEVQGQYAQAAANAEHAQAAQKELKQFLEEAQGKLTAAFTIEAAKVLDEKGEKFNTRGRTDLATLLKPFSDNLDKFQGQVASLYGDEARQRAALTGAVNELKLLNQDMATKAAALTQALRGNAKIRGDWGELMLESVLRGSGLEEGTHYERQQTSTDEEGRRLRPDVIVHLPDDRHVVVDSKVNLVAWQDAMNSMEDPDAHSIAMQRHTDALRRHVKDLVDRNYPRSIGDRALDVTIAFVPIEGALSAALGTDPSLQNYAFERAIVFASPNTLMAMLRVIDRLWVRDTMQKQVLEIGETGTKVLEALSAFVADFEMVGKRLQDAESSFASARNRLSESRQGVIPRARRLAEMGVKSRKRLHEELRVESPQDVPLAALGAEPDSDGQ